MLKNLNKVFINIKQSLFSKFVAHNYATQVNVDNKSKFYSILNPFIDFDERLNNGKLLLSIKERNTKINYEKLVHLWREYKQIEETKLKLENSRAEIVEKIKKSADKESIEGLKVKGKIIRQDLKNLASVINDLEEILLPAISKLPNDVENDMHQRDVETFSTPKSKTEHHLVIGKKLDLIEYISPFAYFLKNEAAEFELAATSYFSNFLIRQGFVPFSNPDFSRSIIVKGSNVDPDAFLVLQHNECGTSDLYYLNGTASLMPFCSYFTKHVTESMPVRHISQGRHYLPVNCNHDNGLYSVSQNNAVQIFIGTSASLCAEEFNNAVEMISELYKNFDLHFRVVRIPPPQLEFSEALKLSFQIHSPFSDKYFEVGNLSFYGEYLSKKLRMYYNDNEEKKFISVISGTILKVPPLLAAYLENRNDCKIPDSILRYI